MHSQSFTLRVQEIVSMPLSILIFSTLILGAVSGGEEDDPLPNPPSASISGQVSLFDEGTGSEPNSAMEVRADGLRIEDMTDNEGRFELNNVFLGQVTLVYEKEGYGTYKVFIDDLTEDITLTEIPSLGKKSQTDVITNSVTVQGTDVNIASVTSGTNTPSRYLRYFFSTRSDVSADSYDVFLGPIESDPGANPAVLTITSQQLTDLGFSQGTTVYARVYGDSFYSNDYDDPFEGKRIFPNLMDDTAQSVQFQVP